MSKLNLTICGEDNAVKLSVLSVQSQKIVTLRQVELAGQVRAISDVELFE